MIFQALIAFVLIVVSTGQNYLVWEDEHKHCSAYFPYESINGSLPATVALQRTSCQDLPYVGTSNVFFFMHDSLRPFLNSLSFVHLDYFKSLLAKSPSDYHSSIANAVLSLYTDLAEARKPTIIGQDHIRKHLPTLYELLTKKEKSSSRTSELLVYPISFGLPEETIFRTLPPKTKAFGRVIPGVTSTYFSMKEESQYFADMAKSLFVITYKKAGWDCLRHYEILASGALPLFINIKHCPHTSLVNHPKKIYDLLLHYPGLSYAAHKNSNSRDPILQQVYIFDKLEFDWSRFDHRLYNALAVALGHYTRNVLTTAATAKYFLKICRQNSQGHVKSKPKRLLYLTHRDPEGDLGDYMVDFLLHGLISVLGRRSVIDFPPRLPIYKTFKYFNETDYFLARSQLYGKGFSYGFKIDQVVDSVERNFREIENGIIGRKYDMIVLGSGHRDGYQSKLYFWDLVCQHYHPLEVAFVDGGDDHLHKKVLDHYAPCAAHIFSREGYLSER